ncbi:MAG: DNA alkylation repair protein [Holosporales bacterium]|jgi:3-methyladenine DNA glycosylase AlkD|nr:DNA alkylation repair protein [Holosporales bacterium]
MRGILARRKVNRNNGGCLPSVSSAFDDLRAELEKLANPAKAEHLRRFFKTTPGSYGEHDRFLGITVPEIRKLAKKYKLLHLNELAILLKSKFNEERLFALFILRFQYENAEFSPTLQIGSESTLPLGDQPLAFPDFTEEHCNSTEGMRQKDLVNFYINYIDFVNNWNLVDSSAPYIIGDFSTKTDTDTLFFLVKSQNMWHRRVAVVASHAFIKQRRYDVTLHFAELLLNDPHDLMHKAVGWMLREVGKRDKGVLCAFLEQFATKMPRTMLSYATEHFDKEAKKRIYTGAPKDCGPEKEES